MKKISLVATGDSLITLKQSVHSEPEFLHLLNIIRDVDVAFTNLEMLLHDYNEDCYPAAECGGTYTRAPPEILEELLWMGFDMFSTANNHSLDYMYGGLFNTIDVLQAYGVPYAGTGRDLSEARDPAYLDTGKGRVAVLSACSTFANFGRAGYARRDMKGRPGLNPLRYERWFEASVETIKKLKEIRKELNIPEVHQESNSYWFLKNNFVEGKNIGLHTKPHKEDMNENLESVKDASRQADWVLFSLHAHEGNPNDVEKPAEFIETFARAVISSGAHCFIGHGHHAMRGIEIYDDKPIFYSLGNFIFQNETVLKMPSDFYARYNLDPYSGKVSQAFDTRKDAPSRLGYPIHPWFTKEEKYWISILPRMEFESDKLVELKLYPIELGQHKPRSQRGRPMLTNEKKGKKILQIIKNLSNPYGTEISIKDNVGIVKL
jgi:poly-gamma-glutamate synthesis protein (capsule biosynthesis protein)